MRLVYGFNYLKLPLFNTVYSIYTLMLLNFNKKGSYKPPSEAKDNKGGKGEVKYLFNLKRSRPKVVYKRGRPTKKL
jgi:hypothetical protein